MPVLYWNRLEHRLEGSNVLRTLVDQTAKQIHSTVIRGLTTAQRRMSPGDDRRLITAGPNQLEIPQRSVWYEELLKLAMDDMMEQARSTSMVLQRPGNERDYARFWDEVRRSTLAKTTGERSTFWDVSSLMTRLVSAYINGRVTFLKVLLDDVQSEIVLNTHWDLEAKDAKRLHATLKRLCSELESERDAVHRQYLAEMDRETSRHCMKEQFVPLIQQLLKEQWLVETRKPNAKDSGVGLVNTEIVSIYTYKLLSVHVYAQQIQEKRARQLAAPTTNGVHIEEVQVTNMALVH